MNPDDLALGEVVQADLERLDDATLHRLATSEDDLDLATAAIVELSGRPDARVVTATAARTIVAGSWQDQFLKAAALDAAFLTNPALAVELSTELLTRSAEPVLVDAMIRGIAESSAYFRSEPGRSFVRVLRAVAERTQPNGSCDREVWQGFLASGDVA